MQNVVPDLYSCGKNCTSKNLTAEHISTVTKQHRFKRLPGDYILKWMTGSSLWRGTVTITRRVPSGWEDTEQWVFYCIQTQAAQQPISKGNHAKVPLSHPGEQNAGFCIDHRPLRAEGGVSPQSMPSVCTAEINGNSLAQLSKWSHHPHQPTYICIDFHFSQHLAGKRNEPGFLRCKWGTDFTVAKTPLRVGMLWLTYSHVKERFGTNIAASCIWDPASQKGLPLTCVGNSK